MYLVGGDDIALDMGGLPQVLGLVRRLKVGFTADGAPHELDLKGEYIDVSEMRKNETAQQHLRSMLTLPTSLDVKILLQCTFR